MLAMPRLSGSAAALIAALASYRPMPHPPAQRRAGRDLPKRKAVSRASRRHAVTVEPGR